MERNNVSTLTTARESAPLARSAHRPAGSGWHFRFLHFAAVAITLPIFAIARLWPGHWQNGNTESVFAEANNAALIAFGFALMS